MIEQKPTRSFRARFTGRFLKTDSAPVKPTAPDYRLKRSELNSEGRVLVKAFTDLFGLPDGVFLPVISRRGESLYTVEQTLVDGPEGHGNKFRIVRSNHHGRDDEDLTIITGEKAGDTPTIIHKHRLVPGWHEDVVKDYRLAVTGAWEMLERTQRDVAGLRSEATTPNQ
jgi:hypothetical protein